MTTQVDWNDGSGQKITLTYNSTEGTQTISVSSAEYSGYLSRTKDITFTASANGQTVTQTLTVTQSGKNITIITFNDNAITSNDVAVGYEQQ